MSAVDADLAELVDLAPRIAGAIARRVGRLDLVDELESGALEGLGRAALAYDAERGVPFLLYGRLRMHGAVWDTFRSWVGRTPTSRRLSASPLGVTDETLGATTASAEDWAVAGDELAAIREAIGALNPRQRDALLAEARGESQEDVADRHGVTSSRVSQLRKEGLHRVGLAGRIPEHATTRTPRAA